MPFCPVTVEQVESKYTQEVTAKSCDLQLSTEKSASNISFLLPSSFGSVYFLCILLQISSFSSVESLELLFFKNGFDKYCICKHFLRHFEGLVFGDDVS